MKLHDRNNRRRWLSPLLASAGILAALTGISAASPVADFTCKVLAHPALQRDGYLLGENIYFLGERVGLVGYAEPAEQLPQVVSGSGMQFSNGTITFAAKGNEGFLQLNDGTTFPCVANASASAGSGDGAGAYRIARSLFGSIVRDGDSPSARELDRIPLGDPIEIISETGSFYDGWQWIRIRYSEGLEGYVWGGTICTTGGPAITGVHASCN
ncbi:SH3 domain-containing protein [Salaquimonas pukyongi]|uniref:SH3 domain-containing protein n=1 Tax=Salaquimonas pukyongi TaxID=2712698 RepID=UPI00096B8558|nr:SH3 domain-containing protein [Salaquimonas pukyongi]